jgi:hypothetical protein
MNDTPEFGEFGFRTVVGAYEPSLETMLPTRPYFGLNLQVQYVYGFLGAASGTTYVVERKFMGSMTGGLYLMANDNGSLRLDPGTSRSARGELRRSFDEKHRRWADPVIQRTPAGVAPTDEQPLTVEITGNDVSWAEGELLELEGTVGGLGVQFYAPMPAQPWFYSSHPYRAQGTVLGEPVEGIVVMEQGYWHHGYEPKEYCVFADLEMSWNAFGNVYDDSVQWGYLVRGKQGLCCAAVVEGDEVITLSNEMTASYEIDDTNHIPRATFEAGGDTWEFVGDSTGHMDDFADSRWGGYGCQGGKTTRRGDDRVPRFSYGWFEYFTGRIPAENRIA